ncbi:MAG: hypothetical protein JXA18_02010, partial [Chitinispirillaceae bacterium]|nr:hypothetical protein [Chitinispirillaceae bacterium]
MVGETPPCAVGRILGIERRENVFLERETTVQSTAIGMRLPFMRFHHSLATVRITNLRLDAVIGCNDWERNRTQEIVI